jgi:hypothetical protein
VEYGTTVDGSGPVDYGGDADRQTMFSCCLPGLSRGTPNPGVDRPQAPPGAALLSGRIARRVSDDERVDVPEANINKYLTIEASEGFSKVPAVSRVKR